MPGLLCARLSLALLSAAAGRSLTAKHAWGWNAEASDQQRFVEQHQDHFDSNNDFKWMQAYYVNDTFWGGADSGAPIFLYIGGEGPLGSSSVTNNFLTDRLPTTKAMLFGLEHRYYGCIRNMSSCPYDNSTERHLQFLSAKQALADLAAFRQFATKKYGLRPDSKWVAVGGSYPGMLAAFVRAEYPDLFHSAIASSAPVKGILDMVQFENIVSSAYALHVEGVEGSPRCRDQIAKGHQDVERLLATPDGRKILAKLFPGPVSSPDWLQNPENRRFFAGCGVASFPAQSNQPFCKTPGCGISQICRIMSNASLGSTLKRLAVLRKTQDRGSYEHGLGVRMVNSCEMDWQMPGDVPETYDEVSVNAYWGYQTCTEFGFYQTCEKSTDCFFTQGLVSFSNPSHKPNDFCSSVLDTSTEDTKMKIAETGAYYAGKVAKATRIIWANGNVDPWHGRSHLTPPGKEQPCIWPIEGASHCAWMSAARPDEQESLKTARSAIFAQISKWLKVEDSVESVVV